MLVIRHQDGPLVVATLRCLIERDRPRWARREHALFASGREGTLSLRDPSADSQSWCAHPAKCMEFAIATGDHKLRRVLHSYARY